MRGYGRVQYDMWLITIRDSLCTTTSGTRGPVLESRTVKPLRFAISIRSLILGRTKLLEKDECFPDVV